MRGKSTNAEIERRVNEVLNLVLEGRTSKEIIRHASAAWNISSRQTEDYIKWAKEELVEINKVSQAENVALIAKNLWQLYRKCISTENTAEANKVLMNIAKIKGLGSENVNHTVTDERENTKDIPSEALDALLLNETH